MASAQPIVDHDRIREWAEERGARPACVKGTGGRGDTGMIRLDFPGFSGAESLRRISWEQWFDAFDRNHLALIVQDKTMRGQQSNFNKLVSRDSNGAAKRGGRSKGGRSTSSAKGRSTSSAKGRSTSSAKGSSKGGRRGGSRKTSGGAASRAKATGAARSQTSRSSGSGRSRGARKTSSKGSRSAKGSRSQKGRGRGGRTQS
jgi:hypothetical protein